ncbi:MAG: N-acetyltransferase [Gammaproteobacteria bacterium]|nr:N-acetyltransferase [Gammaproteobacteria bacterium]NIR85486.1 N-acetyltransferase [Gammaproteobacteria bacterium]NIR89538.1 N-acetyltransferase [Gammaproteobacteria bacterium]NIU06623.1 N-acetyltransferase [Gammaproteobacteria bacterium]NIV53506.1 GNAT family N-acetyltransferase [Gammaproteobacteria bacterium]
MSPPRFELRTVDSLEAVPSAEWNRLAGTANPFLRHEFLTALERNRCVGPGTGWTPRHLLALYAGRLVGAVPLYRKSHSFGEFVFDWAWAEAYERAGLAYYPKLVAAVPLTPVTGPRLLSEPGRSADAVTEGLAAGALARAREQPVSSLHCLFAPGGETGLLEARGLLRRAGCQFHWPNPGYRDFEDFLDALSSKRRKQIRRERREAAGAGIEVDVLRGNEVSEHQWQVYHRFYRSTFDRKWGFPSLTEAFFREIGRTMPEAVLLVLARRGDRYVAGALFLRGTDALYGRHWGCSEHHRALHFELCYYRGIDYCIREGLRRFEAGAQGEHKIWRGFLPVHTWSAHWIRHDLFREAIADFLARERRAVDRYIEELREHSPYRQTTSTGDPVSRTDEAPTPVG